LGQLVEIPAHPVELRTVPWAAAMAWQDWVVTRAQVLDQVAVAEAAATPGLPGQ